MRKLSIVFLLFIFAIFFSEAAIGQDESPIFRDQIFKPNIHTVQLYIEPLMLTDPVITLNGQAQLRLAFDDLEAGKKNYYFTVIQCNYDWSASELSIYDYISGFNEEEIRDYKFSFTTYQQFTHYSVLFPNADFRITKSGNYILKVYLDDDSEQLVLTKRFIVVENIVRIVSNVNQAEDVRYGRSHQQVNFSILHPGMNISNSFTEIKTLLMQNFRWDNAITGLQPQFVRPAELDYNNQMQTAFPGGKEFRYFDTRTIRYKTDRVRDISEDKNSIMVTLFPDQSRGNAQYYSRKDIDGKFIPGIQDYSDQEGQADYVWVKFSLPVDYPFRGGKIFLLGQFTNWELQDAFRLQYNATTKAYEAVVYLKQGYYEYEYYFSSEEKDADEDAALLLEGNSYDTENQYQILVYYRPFGTRYDQVIGYKTTDTYNR